MYSILITQDGEQVTVTKKGDRNSATDTGLMGVELLTNMHQLDPKKMSAVLDILLGVSALYRANK